jgi:DNA-binding CsgD family transcriptional regulator
MGANKQLTKQEVIIINLIADGKINKEIAGDLWISEKTVKNHISHIFEKLKVNNRMEAVNKYRELSA